MGKVTLVRPDGTTLNVDRDQAEKFKVLGYREEAPEELYTKAVQESTAEYYSRPGQKIRAGLEGVASGVSLGLSDLAFDAMGADVDERAAYNPGVRLGGEIVGSLLPLGPGMLGKAAKAATPAGLLTRGAEAAADAAAIRNYSRAVQVGVQGAVEGAGFGLGAEIANATLNNDPLTVESIGAGLGFGALWGGGIGAIAGKSSGLLEGRTAKTAAGEAQEAATREAFSTFRSGVDDITSHIDDTFKAATTQMGELKAGLNLNKKTAAYMKGKADEAMAAIDAAPTPIPNWVEGGQPLGAVPDGAFGITPAPVGLTGEAGAGTSYINRGISGLEHSQYETAIAAREGSMPGAMERRLKRGAQDVASPDTYALKGTPSEAEWEAFAASKGAKGKKRPVGKDVEPNAYVRDPSMLDEWGNYVERNPSAARAATPDVPFQGGPVVTDDMVREFNAARTAARSAYNDLVKAHKLNDYVGMAKAQEKFNEAAGIINSATQFSHPALLPLEEAALTRAKTSFEDLKKLSAAGAALKSFPVTPTEFASMTSARAEKIIAGADTFLKTKNAEMAGLREALKQNIDALSSAMGLTFDGPPATKLRYLYETSKLAANASPAAAGQLPWLAGAMRRGAEYSGGAIASGIGKSMGMGGIGRTVAYEGGKRMVQALLGIRQGVVGGITKATTDWAPKAAAKAGPLGSRIGALAIRLDGTEDKSTKDAREQMRLRSEEIRGAAGGVRDVLYKNLQGLAELHPELAAALHEHEVAKFEFLLNKLPQDPGLAMNRLKSLWRPSPVEMEKFARYYEVFQNPVAVINQVLKTGKVTPEWAEGLKEMYPALWTELRINMLNRLGDPKVITKLTYNEQVSLGSLLDIPIHSSLTPQFVAGQQQMFLERKQPLAVPPQPGISSNGGRPPGPANDPRASTSQKVTAH